MNAFAKKMKKTAFKKAKKVLPQETVLRIQKQRLEGGFGVSYKPNSYEGRYTYSVVSAVYNAEKYLDDFFESLTTQTINGKRLKLVMVDDGSTDGSAKVIANWKQRFPELIDYYYKENGGQASARNLGLDHVTSDWVTFIDPDDFVSNSYFEEVDKSISAYPDLCFITCRMVFFNETKLEYFDNHPLRSEFAENIALFNVNDDYMPISLSASKSFFKASEIEEQGIRFDNRIKPDFEDAHFLNIYLLSQNTGRVAYMRKPIYYYRKRENGSSTLDSAWQLPEKFSTVFEKGKINLLVVAKQRLGKVPFYIQKTVLYDLQWYFKHCIGHEERTQRFEDAGLKDRFWDNLREVFEYIDADVIEDMPGEWINFETKYACMSTFKGVQPKNQIIYVERIDYKANLMLIRSLDMNYELFSNGIKLKPIETKRVGRTFFGREFYSLYLSWFPLPAINDTLSYRVKDNTENLKLSIRGRQPVHHAQMKMVSTIYKAGWDKYKQDGDSIWLFMDRDTQADDNAEHLYRWIKKNHPEQRSYFALRKEAKDWQRLSDEGFDLLAFGSKEHEDILKKCSTIVSSHADGFVHSYFGDNYYKSKRFVFLQHGVTKDNISGWINGKPIDLIITAANEETYSIQENGSPYLLTSRQVYLGGFPRHDALLRKEPLRKCILVMPTWRSVLSGKKIGKGNIRALNDNFQTSVYKQKWEAFLNNPDLRSIASKMGVDIVFYPHTNTFPYIEAGMFNIPDYVKVEGNQRGVSIQQEFANAVVMITDYSSTAFETAYLNKECLYYQFDSEDFFSGMQSYSKGYFDYEKDGFGPVVKTEEALVEELKACAERGFAPEEKYAKRMSEFFAFRDGKCCERVYKRIKELDEGRY